MTQKFSMSIASWIEQLVDKIWDTNYNFSKTKNYYEKEMSKSVVKYGWEVCTCIMLNVSKFTVEHFNLCKVKQVNEESNQRSL